MTEQESLLKDKFLVAVGSAPSSSNVVRWATRFALATGAECVALSVETDKALSRDARERLDRNLSLARTLGARVETAHDDDVAGTIVAVARECGATMIIVGKSGLSSRFLFPFGAGVSDRIVRESGTIPVTVIQDLAESGIASSPKPRRSASRRAGLEFLAVTGIFLGLVLLGHLLVPFVTYRGIAMIFLIPVIGLSFFAPARLIAAFALFSALALNYFFIPPLYTLSIDSLEDWLLFATYFFAAIVTGSLVTRLKSREAMIVKRQGSTAFLLGAAENMASCSSVESTVGIAKRLIEKHFGLGAAIYATDCPYVPDPAQAAFARSFEEEAKLSLSGCIREIDVSPKMRLRIIPSSTGSEPVVAIGIELPESWVWTVSDDALVASLGNILSLIVLRERSDAISRVSRLELESQRLAKVLLDSVSHEMRTPLTAVTGSLSALSDPAIAGNAASRTGLVEVALSSAATLNRVVEDLISVGRIESGMLRLKKEKVELSEIQESALIEAEVSLKGRTVTTGDSHPSRMVNVDVPLTIRLVSNLLRNAGKYSIPGAPIRLSLTVEGTSLAMEVRDCGPGVAQDRLQHLFEKFRRCEQPQPGGLGLGLAICKGITEAHGGAISAIPGVGEFTVRVVYPDCALPEPDAGTGRNK